MRNKIEALIWNFLENELNIDLEENNEVAESCQNLIDEIVNIV